MNTLHGTANMGGTVPINHETVLSWSQRVTRRLVTTLTYLFIKHKIQLLDVPLSSCYVTLQLQTWTN